MATTYLSPQQLKEFAQKVEEVAKKFPRSSAHPALVQPRLGWRSGDLLSRRAGG